MCAPAHVLEALASAQAAAESLPTAPATETEMERLAATIATWKPMTEDEPDAPTPLA